MQGERVQAAVGGSRAGEGVCAQSSGSRRGAQVHSPVLAPELGIARPGCPVLSGLDNRACDVNSFLGTAWHRRLAGLARRTSGRNGSIITLWVMPGVIDSKRDEGDRGEGESEHKCGLWARGQRAAERCVVGMALFGLARPGQRCLFCPCETGLT